PGPDAGPVPERRLVHGVGAAVVASAAAPVGTDLGVALPRADAEDDARPADDRVLRVRRAMDEVPLPQRPLLPLDDQGRRAGEDEEVLLVGLPVIHRQRLSRPENGDPEPELLEDRVTAEVREPAPTLRLVPAHLARVDDEPAFAFAHESVVGDLHGRLRDVHAAQHIARLLRRRKTSAPSATTPTTTITYQTPPTGPASGIYFLPLNRLPTAVRRAAARLRPRSAPWPRVRERGRGPRRCSAPLAKHAHVRCMRARAGRR